MRFPFSYAAAGILCWAALASAQAQKVNPPGPKGDPAPESSITPSSKLDGKTLKEWIADIKATSDSSAQRIAIQTVLKYVAASPTTCGPVARNDAVPAIISLLNKGTAEVSVKVNAAMAVALIGMNEKDLKNGVPCLINLLGDRQAIVRLYAVGALAHLGPDARQAIPNLVNLTRGTEDSETRQAAVNALGIMAWDKAKKEGPDQRVFRALTDALSDHSIQVRYDAIKALILITPTEGKGRIASADRNNAISKLEGLLLHKDKVEVIWAHMALMLLDNQRLNDVNLKAIAKILKLGDARVRCNASQALGGAWKLEKMIPNLPSPTKNGWKVVIDDLVELLSDKDLGVVFCAINALGDIGPPASKAKGQLEKLANHNDKVIQQAAQQALEKITGKAKMKFDEPKPTAP
jgi:HEAT repeat protein